MTLVLILLLVLTGSCSTTGKLQSLRDEQIPVSSVMSREHIPTYESTLPVYYNTGAEWNNRSLELIEGAEDYIIVSTFLGVEHPSTNPVWDALARKVEQGVRVYILIDSSSNFQLVPEVNERIKAAFMYLRDLGLPFVEYNSLTLSNAFFMPSLLDRDHRKYWVVDGEMLAVGGINVNQTSLDWPAGLGNIDTMAEVVSPGATRAVIDTFVETWNRYSPRHLNPQHFVVGKHIPENRETTTMWLFDHHWPIRSNITTLFDVFSAYAEEELWLIQGYTFLTPALLDRIRFVTERGVAVHVMLSENSSQPKYEMASRYGVLDILDAGATVYMYDSPEGAFLHLKLMVADGVLTTIGSANYNLRSQTLSRELNVLFEDERVASYSMDYIQELLKHSRLVTREEAESYRTIRSWYNYILMQVWG